MLLAIDAGNTNVVFALRDQGRLIQRWRISTTGSRTADEYMVWLSQLMALENMDPKVIDGAVIATVVPQALFPLQLLCRRYFNCDAVVVGEKSVNLGIMADIDNPLEVGADRLVNAVAAHAEHPGALVILDFGTATTFDVIDSKGAYKGGVIAPGINLSLEALHMAAAKLPRIAPEEPPQVIGRNTVNAMQSGVYWGYVGLIEGIISRIKTEFSKPMTVIATGGLAPLFDRATDMIEVVDQELTIKGLFRIFDLNRAS